MLTTLRHVFAIASLLVFTAPAFVRADNPFAWWTHMGAMGTPTTSTLSLANFNDTGTVSIRSSVASGTLRMRYNVTAVDGVIDETGDHERLCFMMTARADSADSRVIATLYHQTIADNGARFVLGTIDTAKFPPNGTTGYRFMANCQLANPWATGTPLEILDFGYGAFFIDVQLIKRNSAGNPGLQTVAIGRLGT